MHTFVKRALWGTVIAGGLTLFGTSVATAAETTGEDGLLSGTQAVVDLDAPVSVVGNAVSVIGDSESSSEASTVQSTGGGSSAPEPAATTDGSHGIGSGSQAVLDVEAPITVSGNAISVLGDSSSESSTTTSEPVSAPVTAETSGEDSILGGTQGVVSVDAPITVAGNAVSLIGDSDSSSTTDVNTGDNGESDGGITGVTSGEDSILGGTQVIAPVTAPVTVAGNAISGIGDSDSSSTTDVNTGSNGESGGGITGVTSGEDSILGGTQVIAPITAPVTVAGNAISGIGDSDSSSTTDVNTGSNGESDGGITGVTSGEDSILGGTQVIAPITAPVTVAGNAISGIGDSDSSSTTDVNTGSNGGGITGVTSGEDSILGGTQVIAPITAPVTVAGNAISGIGDSDRLIDHRRQHRQQRRE
ncbi:chaplin family protein [Microbacterium sp. ET2]|uniref:chaplin family protein n=1 Tax=Microbacterium albipurpureum TaxID=3050384 RepID=UPI00259CF975|nr:chaplin family protein [Microbacterium sp. ET2 (Ac-2212)]WJL94228.1 chaplin family protein [Microbacterium sp. ET2 (Ac-2212)]